MSLNDINGVRAVVDKFFALLLLAFSMREENASPGIAATRTGRIASKTLM